MGAMFISKSAKLKNSIYSYLYIGFIVYILKIVVFVTEPTD